ncbi:MAG: hypothetical protein ACK5LO_03130 [Leucobacter sp.]
MNDTVSGETEPNKAAAADIESATSGVAAAATSAPRRRGRHAAEPVDEAPETRAADTESAEAESAVAESGAEADPAQTDATDLEQTDAADAADPEATQTADPQLPPDAAARDAAKRDAIGEHDDVVHGEDITFVTRRVSDEERAAAIAVLTAVRTAESQQRKRVARRDREPWARSQRVPEGISDLLLEG